MKYIFLDLETTGANYLKHGIYQIGGIIKYDQIYQEFEFNCNIFSDDEIDPKAFEKALVKSEDLKLYPDPLKIYDEFIKILSLHCDKYNKQDKFIFANFFAGFDYDFLRRWFEAFGDNYFGSYFFHPPLAIEALALEYLKDERSEMPNFKLSTVCKHCGIQVDEKKTHTALYDAKLSMMLYDKMTTEIDKQYEDDVPF